MPILPAEEIINTARAASNKAIAEQNVEALSKYWMDDIVIIRGNGSIISTKKHAVAVWQKMFTDAPGVSYMRNTVEIIISNDEQFAWEKGVWTGINTYSAGGNYAAMWRNNNNEWKLQAELFVSL